MKTACGGQQFAASGGFLRSFFLLPYTFAARGFYMLDPLDFRGKVGLDRARRGS